jgi:hypothetical protein
MWDTHGSVIKDCVVTLCHWVSSACRFEGSWCLHLQGQAGILILQNLGNCRPVTEHCTPEDVDLQQHGCQNLKSRTVSHLLNYIWSSTLKAPCYTLAFLTVQLLTERPKEMVTKSDKPELMKGWRWIDYITNQIDCCCEWAWIFCQLTVFLSSRKSEWTVLML